MRLAKFNLKISEEKTQILKFGRKAWVQAKRTGAKVKSFTFLGFTHLCVKSRNGMFMMGHKTSKQGLARKLKSVAIWLQDIRNVLPLIDWWPVLKAKLNGHYGYFGINGNMRCLNQYYYKVRLMVFESINRRSQRKSMDWETFSLYLQWNPLPTPAIKHQIWG